MGGGGGGWDGAGVSGFFFTVDPNLKEGVEVGGNRVSKFFLQRTQIRKKKTFFFFFWGGGGGGGGVGGELVIFFTKNPNQKEIEGGGRGKGARANEFLLLRIKI